MDNKRPMRKIKGARTANRAPQQGGEGRIERAAPGNDAAQSTTGGTSTLNNNTTGGSIRKPRPRKAKQQGQSTPAPGTISAEQQTAKKARAERRAHNADIKKIQKARAELNREFRASNALAKRTAAESKAAKLSGDAAAQAKADAEHAKVIERRNLNARRRAGLTRAEQNRVEKISNADDVINASKARIEHIRAERHRVKAVKRQEEIERSKRGTPKSEHPNRTTIGGDTFTNAATDDPNYKVEQVNQYRPDILRLANRVVQENQNEPLAPARRIQGENRAAELFKQVEDAGITVNVNGQPYPAVDALDAGMEPDVWWNQVRHHFNDESMDRFPYKGFVSFR